MSAWREVGAQIWAFTLAIAVHALMALLVVLGTMNWQPFKTEQPQAIMIEATMVDTSRIREQREEALRAQEQERRRQERDEQLRLQREREQQQELEQEREREAALEQQKQRDAQQRLQRMRDEQERKRAEELEQQQRELEKVRAEAEAAERKRQQEAERLKQVEAQRQREEFERRRLEEEAALQRKLADEQREFQAGRIAEKSDEYQAAIQSFVTQNWLRPPSAQPGLRCNLRIIQIPGGEVISASIRGNCDGDEATRRSIVAAVERGGALPYRGFEDVFAREIDFIFIYDGD